MLRVDVIIFAALFLLSVLDGPESYAQTDWDVTLDKYEQICDRCLEVKKKVSEGEFVQQGTVTALIQELGRLRSLLQNNSGSMNVQQKRRFEEIRRKYSSAKPTQKTITNEPVPAATAAVQVPVPVAENVVHADRGVESGLLPACVAIRDTLRHAAHLHLVFPERTACSYEEKTAGSAQHSGGFHFSALLQSTVSVKPSFGGMVSFSSERMGAYLSCLSSFSKVDYAYECTSAGDLPEGGKFWGDGGEQSSRQYYTAGILYRFNDYVEIFLGGGFGESMKFWRDTDGTWARVSDLSFNGFAAQLGVMGTFHHISLGASAIWLTTMSSITPSIVLGYTF